MNLINFFFVVGLSLSLGVGIWHFFMPSLFNWHKYIPNAPKWLWIAINWCNIFFSICLTGLSLLLLMFQQEIYHKEIVAFSFYILLLIVWFSRIIITAFYNWGHDLVWKFQLLVPALIFILVLMPLLRIIIA